MRGMTLLACTFVLAASAFGQRTVVPHDDSAQKIPLTQAADATANQPPEHPITRVQVHEILQLTGANQLAAQMMRAMMVNLRGTFPPYVPKNVIDEIETGMETIDFEPMTVEAYQKHISTEDATQIIAFYKTPVGKRLIDAMPQITREMQESGAQMGRQIVQEIIERHKDEIENAAKKYQQDHLVTPAITSPN